MEKYVYGSKDNDYKEVPEKYRFDSEEQYEIARESIDKAFEEYFHKSGYDDMGYEGYESYVDLILSNSDETAFHGTDEEIRKGWFDTEIFGGVESEKE